MMIRWIAVCALVLVCGSCSEAPPKNEQAETVGIEAPQVAPPSPIAAGPSVTPAPTPTAGPTLTPVAATPEKPADLVVGLPGDVTEVVVGGDGRYLLLSIPDLQKVGVFDLREAKVLKYVGVPSKRFFVAGGATRFVIVDITNRRLSKWKYDSLDAKEAEAPIEMKGRRQLMAAVMGPASEGPLALSFNYDKYERRQVFIEPYDLQTLTPKALTVDWKSGNSSFSPRDEGKFQLGVNPASTSFSLLLSTNLHEVTVGDGSLTVHPERQVDKSGSYANPYCFFHDGKTVFRRPEIVFADGRKLKLSESGSQIWRGYPGQFWLSGRFPGDKTGGDLEVGIHIGDQTRPLTTFTLPIRRAVLSGRPSSSAEKTQLYFSRAEKTLIALPDGRRELLVKRIDPEASFMQSDAVVLAVTTEPPVAYIPGQKYEYAIGTLSNRGGVKYRLDDGPPGMTVSPEGKVEWTPAEDVGPSQSAIVSISDGVETQVFHNLKLFRGELSYVEVPADLTAQPIDPSTPRVILKLPARADDLVVGGSGRFLLAPMSSIAKLAVIDVKARKILKLLPIDGEKTLVAAGATRFIVYSGKGVVSRWNFARLEREMSVPVTAAVAAVCMGSSSEGPLLIAQDDRGGPPVFVDLKTLKVLKLPAVRGNDDEHNAWVDEQIACSANGQVFCSYTSESTASAHSLVMRTDDMKMFQSDVYHGPVCPSPDGTVIHTYHGLHSGRMKPLEGQTRDDRSKQPQRLTFPATSGPYYLGWSSATESEQDLAAGVWLYVQGTKTPIVKVSGIPAPLIDPKDDRIRLYAQRLLLMPASDAICTLGGKLDQILIHRFVIDEALQKAKGDRVVVTSVPPPAARPATRLSYQLEAFSKAGDVKYELESGPKGAQISASGLLTWTVSGNAEPEPFVVTATDAAGAESVHSFNIEIDKKAAGFVPSPVAVLELAANAAASSANPATAADPGTTGVARVVTEVAFPAVVGRTCVGGGGRYVVAVIKDSKQVAILDVVAKQLVRLLPVNDDDIHVAAGATKLVICQGTTGTLLRYDLARGMRELTVATDLQNVRSLAIGANSEGPILAVTGRDNFTELKYRDLQTLKPAEYTFERGVHLGSRGEVAVSADGRTFNAGDGSATIVDKSIYVFGDLRNVGGSAVPGADGRFFYNFGGIWTLDGTNVVKGNSQNPETIDIPAATGSLYVKFHVPKDGKQVPNPTLHVQGDAQPIVALDGIRPPRFVANWHSIAGNPLTANASRCFVLPASKALVTISDERDKAYIHAFDLDEELKRADVDYFFVGATPPTVVSPKTPFRFQLDVRSKQGGVKYRLDAGPTGMSVSSDGLLFWQPSGPSNQDVVVIVNVSDASGREILHSFKLRLDPSAPALRPPETRVATPAVAATPSLPSPPPASAPSPMSPSPASPSPPAMPEAAPGDRATTVVKLPAALDDVCVGGAGRYLVCQFKSLKQIVVVDIQAKKVAKYVPVDDAQFLFAAGATKLVVALTGKQVLERYNLADGVRETSVNYSGKPIAALAMGSASEGPLLIAERDRDLRAVFYDLATLKAVTQPEDRIGREIGQSLTAAADGSLFASWRSGTSPSGVFMIRRVGAKAEVAYEHHSAMPLLPNSDGRLVYSGDGLFAANAKPLGSREHGALMQPASLGPLYLKMTNVGVHASRSDGPPRLSLHMQDVATPLLVFADIQLPEMSEDIGARIGGLPMYKRLHFLPPAGAIVTVPLSADQLVIQQFDLDQELARSGVDYLFASSVPPPGVKSGATFRYQIEVKSKRGGVQYRLETGPPGLTVSPAGLVNWTVPTTLGGEQLVIVVLADASGQEAFHNFRIAVDSTARPATAGTTGVAPGPTPAASPSPTSPGAAPSVSGTPPATAGARNWTSSDGLFTITATFVKLAGGKVTLRKADGTTVDVPLGKLSTTDQALIRTVAP
jgi:hypothetical protein